MTRIDKFGETDNDKIVIENLKLIEPEILAMNIPIKAMDKEDMLYAFAVADRVFEERNRLLTEANASENREEWFLQGKTPLQQVRKFY